MTPLSLHAVLRRLADDGSPHADEELLKRYAATRDEGAFAELVRRHGRLVWAACRHLTRTEADADDAFQATFLVLIRDAARVRHAGRLAAWLHGVAYRVCSKVRVTARRRGDRERAASAAEPHSAVPDSAWDRAAAAVHEEAAQLPDALRAAFVLCCLEGCGQAEAAGRLGWKAGTLAGRLARAKAAVLAGLDARGLTAGLAVAAVGIGAVAAPAKVLARAAALASDPGTVPGSISNLSHGVIGMSVSRVKLLAAGVLLACGLGLGAWGGLASKADAEPPKAEAPTAYDKPGRPISPAAGGSAVDPLAAPKASAADKPESKEGGPPRWLYRYEPQLVGEGSGLKPAELEAKLAGYESDGWQFVGQVTMRVQGTTANELPGGAGLTLPTLVFRKPAGVARGPSAAPDLSRAVQDQAAREAELARQLAAAAADQRDLNRALQWALQATQSPAQSTPAKPGDKRASPEVQAVLAEIRVLQAKLAELTSDRPPAAASSARWKLDPAKLPLEPGEFVVLLEKMAAKKFPKGSGEVLTLGYDTKESVLTVSGTRAAIEWAGTSVRVLIGDK